MRAANAAVEEECSVACEDASARLFQSPRFMGTCLGVGALAVARFAMISEIPMARFMAALFFVVALSNLILGWRMVMFLGCPALVLVNVWTVAEAALVAQSELASRAELLSRGENICYFIFIHISLGAWFASLPTTHCSPTRQLQIYSVSLACAVLRMSIYSIRTGDLRTLPIEFVSVLFHALSFLVVYLCSWLVQERRDMASTIERHRLLQAMEQLASGLQRISPGLMAGRMHRNGRLRA